MIRVRVADAGAARRPPRRRRVRRPDRGGLTAGCPTDRTPPATGRGCSRPSASTRSTSSSPTSPIALRASRLDLPPPEPELELAARLTALAATEPDRPRVVPRRRRLPALEPARRRPAPAPRRVVHGVHAVPARGQPGHPPEHLRVRVADRRAGRPRRRLGVALRRRRRDGRGRADDVPRDPPRAGARQSRRPPALPRHAADVLRRRPRARRDPARRRRTGRRDDRPRGARADARRPGPAGRGRGRRAAGLPRACSSRCPRSASWPTPPARCSSRSSSRSAWPCSRRPAPTARTSRRARASRSASRRSTAARISGSSPPPTRWSARSPAGSSGMTTDLDGQRAFVMTMRAREQDIRRDKAASNICTNQALLALAASIYLAIDRAARTARRRRARGGAGGRARGGPRGRRRRAAPSRSVPQRVRRPGPRRAGRPPAPARATASSPAWSSPTRSRTTRHSPTACSCARPR